MPRNVRTPSRFSQPSAWVVLGSGILTVFFLVAIVREVIRTTTVRRQVQRLQQELATQTKRQADLQDLIGYLSSPTFQEREARLRLGLKKNGERVIVIPPTAEGNGTTQNGQGSATGPVRYRPIQQWWNYFFGQKDSTS